MNLTVSDIIGLPGVPTTASGTQRWLKSAGIGLAKVRNRLTFSLLSLSAEIQEAYRLRQVQVIGLPMGQQDDAARMAFEAKPMGVQQAGHERAAMLLFVYKHRAAGLKPAEIRAEFTKLKQGAFPSDQTINRWFERIVNVDPVNWPAALAPHYEGKKDCAEIAAEAWDYFEFIKASGGKNGTGLPLKDAWKRTQVEAKAKGWVAGASYRTYVRRWDKLSAARRRTFEMGAEAAAASLTMYQPRTAVLMRAMEQVELDGREFGVLVRWRDGTVSCPWVILIVDRASSKILGWSISTSENAEAVRAAIINVCEDHGIPDLLLTDNGKAINSKTIIGGLKPRYRTKQTAAPDWEVPGVMAIYGIELQNTAPGAPRGKLPESIYSALRHVDNAPEFYRAQRSGPSDTPNPNPVPVGYDLFEAVFAKKIQEFHNMTDSRAQGLRKGESRDQAFERLHEGRARRYISPLQRRSVPMIWKPRKVTSDGRVKFLDGLFGDATTQDAMLQHEGKTVLIGIDPNDYHAPAIVRGWEDEHLKGRVLIEKLPAYETTSVRDEKGRRAAVTEKRRANSLARSHEIKDMDKRVEELRAAALLPVARPDIVLPVVHQLDTRGPFSPAAAFHQLDPKTGEVRATNDEYEAAQTAALEFMFPSKGMERREVSGGNR